MPRGSKGKLSDLDIEEKHLKREMLKRKDLQRNIKNAKKKYEESIKELEEERKAFEEEVEEFEREKEQLLERERNTCKKHL